MIKDELEWTAGYFNQYFYEPAGVTVNSAVRDYNYDMWSGIEYQLDVTKPVGQRVVELKLNGQPLAMDQLVRVALNNYRATGKFPTATKLFQSTVEVRELITNWIMERGTISPEDVFVENWSLLPPVNTWMSTTTSEPISRDDYAELLWTAFGCSQDSSGMSSLYSEDLGQLHSLYLPLINSLAQEGMIIGTSGPSGQNTTNPSAPSIKTDMASPLTAFGCPSNTYMRIPGDKGMPGSNLNREGAFFLLRNAVGDLIDVQMDMSVLNKYSDKNDVSKWAKNPIAFTILAWIFMPTGNELLPKQIVTNAEALAWIREARYPYYTFLSTNDFHGQLETGKYLTESGNKKFVGGAAYNMTYINGFKSINPFGTLLMDAGDMMQGTPISNLLWGESVIDVFNHMGYRAATIGNHEFDWGQPRLQDRIAQAEFPILLANVFIEGTDSRPDWMAPTAIAQRQGPADRRDRRDQ